MLGENLLCLIVKFLVMEVLDSKSIWKKTLEANPSGKEFLVKKEKKKVMSGESYLQLKNKKKKNKETSIKVKSRPLALSYLKNGEIPATQKQIDYIESLLKKSTIKYDYNFQRDKYGLSVYVATLFIDAIKAGNPFKIHEHIVKPVKYIKPDIPIEEDGFLFNE